MTHLDYFVSGLIAAIGFIGAGIIAAMSEASTVALAIAVIGAISATASAHLANSARKDVKERIGEPNGSQDVVSMLTRILEGQTGQDSRLAVHDALFAKMDTRLNVLSTSVDSIRKDCHFIRLADEATATKVQDIAGKVAADRRHSDHEGDTP